MVNSFLIYEIIFFDKKLYESFLTSFVYLFCFYFHSSPYIRTGHVYDH